MATMTLELDDADYRDIQRAIASRQLWQVMPDGDGNAAGRVLAEICRGWLERLDIDNEDE